MDVLNQLFKTFKVTTEVFHNGQYCGNWAVDTSGTQYMSFHIVSHGRCFLKVESHPATTTLEAGDMVLFPRDASHCLTNDEHFDVPLNQATSDSFDTGLQPQGTGLVCGYFAHHHPLFSNIIDYLPDHLIIRKTQDSDSPVTLMMEALLRESREINRGSELILARMSEAILAMLLRDHLPTDSGVLAALTHPKLNKAMQAIHAQPGKKWSVEHLAELCFLSRAGFSDLFKDIVGIPPMDYVIQWRLSLAYRMLADDKVSTLEAALHSGYESEASFSKAFKRVIGLTPGAVRAA